MNNILDKLNETEYINIDGRKIKEKDILKLEDHQVLSVKHKKGFMIYVRRKYVIEKIIGILVLMYSASKYIVSDELLGKHSFEFDAKDMAEYVNGLLGYE